MNNLLLFVDHNYSINLSPGMINRIDIFFMLASPNMLLPVEIY